jgi:hypothetical protein
MNVLSSIGALLQFLFRRSRVERELEEKLCSHLRSRADDLEHQGFFRAEAERQARIGFGAYQRYKEECRDALGTRLPMFNSHIPQVTQIPFGAGCWPLPWWCRVQLVWFSG